MRIQHIFFTYPNPYQPYNTLLVDRMRKYGFECNIFVLSGQFAPQQGGLDSTRVVYRLIFAFLGIRYFKRASKLRRSEGIGWFEALTTVGRYSAVFAKGVDVIHIHQIQAISDPFFGLLKLQKVPWVVSLRGFETTIMPILSDNLNHFVTERIKFAFGIHAVSESLRKRAVELGANSEKVCVIRRTPENTSGGFVRASFSDLVIELTFIGRMNWKKGLVFLIQAVAKLIAAKRRIHLNICGTGSQSEEAELRYWIWLLSVSENVSIHGYLTGEELNNLLSRTHIYVQPSINEGIPNTLLRALSWGLPIVATNVDGIPEVIKHEQNGLLVPPGDSDALAQAIDRILVDGDIRTRLIRSSSSRTVTDPSVEMELYMRFYTQVSLEPNVRFPL
ncbi:MAG: glycosyltransferase family 4 protein [Cyclobacteriaceae bacterium]|nr:glycosyltransferase family 4 protein [Cyclobacteriaceae bacterium]